MSEIETFLMFTGYKSLLCNSGTKLKVHEGEYAVNIKSTVQAKYINDVEEAYEYASHSFFNVVDHVTKIFGFRGISVEGRHGKWLKPLVEINGVFKTIKADTNDYVGFEEKMMQIRIEAYADTVTKIRKDIETIYIHSKTIDELKKLIEEMFEV